MSPRELARRRMVVAAWLAWAALLMGVLAVSALDELGDEDQAPECPFDRAPVDDPMCPADVDRLMSRDAAAYRAGWDERGRYESGQDRPAPRR